MKISFWSPSQGVGAVTSNLACISAMFSMVFRYKSIIIENHRQKNKINHFMESRINQNLVFEDNSYYYNYTGMDSVLYKLSLKEGRFLKSNLADVEKMIVNELNSVFDDYLFYISSDNKMNNIIFEQLLSQYIPTIIEASKRFANLTFIDTQSSNNLSTPYILQEADLIVVNISQDPVELDNLFKNYKSILSKCLFLISNYNEESYFNLNKISQMFEIDQSRIAAIPFNSDYKDALTRGSLVSYLIHNYDSRTNHENAKFVNAIIKATIMINNRLSFVVNKRKTRRIYGRSFKRSSPKLLIAIFVNVFVVLFCLIFSYIILNKIKTDYELDIKGVKDQMESQKIFAYEAKNDINVGQVVTEDDLKFGEIYSSQGKEYYITEEHLGMVSKINIKKGTYLLEDMLVKDEKIKNLREIEYNVFLPNSNLNESDHVDIRIIFPNGEDYIVLSKKNIKNLNKETGNCYLWLSEKEILDMAGAVVDTYVFPGSKIYTTKYLEPELQKASDINYKPNIATLELIQKNTNILKDMTDLEEILLKPEVHRESQRFRKELEFRLNDFYDKTNQNYQQPIVGIGANKEEVIEYDE